MRAAPRCVKQRLHAPSNQHEWLHAAKTAAPHSMRAAPRCVKQRLHAPSNQHEWLHAAKTALHTLCERLHAVSNSGSTLYRICLNSAELVFGFWCRPGFKPGVVKTFFFLAFMVPGLPWRVYCAVIMTGWWTLSG